MKKFLEFLNRLIFSNKPKDEIFDGEPSVYDMDYISSELNDGKETIIHGKGKYWVKIVIDKDMDKREGVGTVTTNLKRTLTENDIVYLLKKYL